MKKRRIVIIAIIAALLIAIGTVWALFSIETQRAMCLKYPDKPIGMLKFSRNGYTVELAPGLDFQINTARAMSTISQKQLQLLKDMGCAVDSTVAISIGRNHKGNLRVTFKRYTVSLPISVPANSADSCSLAGDDISGAGMDNVIYNVDFAPLADADEDRPTLAIDFLEKFLVEYRHSDNGIVLHTSLPEGFSYVGELEMTDELIDYLRISNRYYMNMTVNHSESRDFFIDTAMDGAGMKLPAENAPAFKMTVDSVMTPMGVVGALVDRDVHVEFGERGVNSSAYYFDDGVEDFAINPFNFFKWTGLIDFPGRKVYIHD